MQLTNYTQNDLAEEVIAGDEKAKETLFISLFPLVDHVHNAILSDVGDDNRLDNEELRDTAERAFEKALDGYRENGEDYRFGTFMTWFLRDVLRSRLEENES